MYLFFHRCPNIFSVKLIYMFINKTLKTFVSLFYVTKLKFVTLYKMMYWINLAIIYWISLTKSYYLLTLKCLLENATDNVDYFINPIYPNVLKKKKYWQGMNEYVCLMCFKWSCGTDLCLTSLGHWYLLYVFWITFMNSSTYT